MLLAIFGAGASFDSVGDHPASREPSLSGRPPLAAELFAPRFGEILGNHPDCAALVPRLRRATNIEQEIENIVTQASAHPDLMRQLLALRYYIRDAITWAEVRWRQHHFGATNYAELLHTLGMWSQETKTPLALLTFNYDRLLDLAAKSALDLRLDDLDSYVAGDFCKLFKVHGSVGWWRVVSNLSDEPLRCASSLELRDEYMLSGADPARSGPNGYVPAISVPTLTKSGFECPPGHLSVLRSVLETTTRVLIVGWRGMEQHFLSEWRHNAPSEPPRMLVIDGSVEGAQAVTRHLGGAGITWAGDCQYEVGFSEVLSGDSLSKFLRS
jgi:hypothetical protein